MPRKPQTFTYDDEELWFPISRFPGFWVSTWGRIRDGEDIVDTWVGKDGLVHVDIEKWDWSYKGPVSLLMLRYIFIGNLKDLEIDYYDGNPHNLHIDNMQILYPNGSGDMVTLNVEILSDGMRSLDRRKKNRVMIVETGEVFDNVADCARHIGGSATNIFAYFRGVTKSVKGYTFKRV